MSLTREEREVYDQCQGACHHCMLEGGCDLEQKLKGGA